MFDDEESGLSGLSGQMERLNGLTAQFGRTLSRSLSQGIIQGKSFEDILRNIGQRFLDIALRAAFKPLEGAISGLSGSLMQGIGSLFSGASAGAGMLGITPFAEGGVVNAPHYFPLGRGAGLMGERGAEAILPLARGPDGRLGVASGGKAGAVSVVMNISTPDADGFRRSEAQVSAMLARAVARGNRGL